MHGSGTYVTDRPLLRNDLSRNFGVSSMIAAMGLEPGTGRRDLRPRRAHRPRSPRRWASPRATPVSVLRRVRTAGGRRVVDVTDWCRARRARAAARWRRSAGGSIYAALAARGLTVHHGVATITPDVAMGEVARRLGVPRGTLLLTLWQVDSTADDTVALVSREHHLADAFEITVYRRGPGDGGEEER